jgi:DNA polymerase III subunit beta
MKLATPAVALADALSLAALARQRDGLATICAAEDITITCTDPGNNIAIKASIPNGNVIESGAASVSASAFGALISAFEPRAVITIKTCEFGLMVERYRLPVAETPTALMLDTETGCIEISGGDCLDLLGVASVAGNQAMRFYLNGVFLHNDGDQLIAVATDGAQLLRVSINAQMFSTDATLIVPTRATTALARLIRATKSDKIELARSARLFSARGSGFELISRLIDARYPNYQSIIPAPTPNTVTVDRAELQAAIARLTAIASGDFPLIGLTWAQGEPLHVFLPRRPADGADDIAAETRGSARIALAPTQIIKMLGEFNSKSIHLNAADRLLFTGGNNTLGLLMPCAWNFET